MAPIAGSAYTYAYVSLGEVIAWIIGWDLILEYAMASSTVANGWSNYFMKFLGLFRAKGGQALVSIPLWLTTDPFTAATQNVDYQAAGTLVVASADAEPIFTEASRDRVALPVEAESGIHRVKEVEVTFTDASVAQTEAALGNAAPASIERIRKALVERLQFDPGVHLATKLDEIRGGNESGYEAYQSTPLVLGRLHLTCNVVALAIVTVITSILVIGIRESAGFNAIMVLIKIAAVLFVVVAGIGYVDTRNWTPFLPYGWSGVFSGAAVIFFAYIGFDSVSTHAEEARNPKRDVPIGIISSLAVCTVLYILVAAVVTGMIPYPRDRHQRPDRRRVPEI